MGKCSAISITEQARAEKVLVKTELPARNRCLFVLGIETGLRISALLSIKISDVVATDSSIRRVLVIQKRNIKGKKKQRRVALSPTARQVIYEAINEMASTGGSARSRHLFAPQHKTRPMTRRHAYALISSALIKAGITHTTGTHTMRKTRAARVAAWALKRHTGGQTATLPVMAVKSALGHESLRTTEMYLQSGAEEVDAGTEAGEI